MARYIDGEQVIRELLSLSQTDGIYGRGLKRGIELALAIVNRQDTADVVEVVRCRECKFAYENRFLGVTYCEKTDHKIKQHHFCSYGERKAVSKMEITTMGMKGEKGWLKGTKMNV